MPASRTPSFEKQLGKRIAAYRRAARLTQEGLAEQVHVTPETISRIERGTTLPSLGTLAGIADVLGMEVGAFFESSGKRPTHDAAINALVRDLRLRTEEEIALVHDLARRIFQFSGRRSRKA